MKLNYKKIIKVVILTLIPLISFSQEKSREINYNSKINDPSANYSTIVENERVKFSKMDFTIKANKKERKQFERWAYLWQDKINVDGSFPTSEQRMSKKDFSNLLTNSNNTARNTLASWTQVGPVNNPAINGYTAFPGKGRINVVAIDPNNENTMYAGAPVGGVWKTTDNGDNWQAMSDNLAGLGVSDIIIDPNDSNIIYIATGDRESAGGSFGNISSIGVYKSTDAGSTWAVTGLSINLTDNIAIRDITFLPGSSTTLFATTGDKIMKSTDSGATWSVLYTSTYGANAQLNELIFDPNDMTKMVCSDIWGDVLYSSDSGANWTVHSVLQGNSANRTRFAVTPNDVDHFYMIDQAGKFSKVKFAFADDASDVVTTTTIAGYNSQYGYNMPIAVSTTNKDNILVGGVNTYKSTDGGVNFSMFLNAYNNPPGVGFYVHPDHHFLGFKSDGVTVVNGHDGGVAVGKFTSTDNSNTTTGWLDKSGQLNITQSYNIAVTQEANGDNFMMANQDNDGFSKVMVGSVSTWVSCQAGDGTSTAIDKDSPNIRYLGGTVGALYRATAGYADGSNQAVTILPTGSQANQAFVSPMKLNPTLNSVIYACYGDVYRHQASDGAFTGNVSDWTPMNTGLSQTKFIDVIFYAGSYIYAIGGNNEAKYTVDNGTSPFTGSWTTINPPSSRLINSISTRDNTTIYCTVSGYYNGDKVFKSTDFGANWTNISANLPNIVMKKILVKANVADETLFVATELGMYWKNSSMTQWEKLDSGLPNVRVEDLEINYTDEKLYIGTFGRGMFKLDVSSLTAGTGSLFSELDMPSIYPNPVTNDVLNVNIPNQLLNKSTKLDYILYNSVGAILGKGNLIQVNNQINVSGLATGIYMIRISNANKYFIKKVIIK